MQNLTRDVKSLVCLPVPRHSTRVFIGTRGVACPCQRHLDPQVPGLSLEYSHEGRLQTVITVNFITELGPTWECAIRAVSVIKFTVMTVCNLPSWEYSGDKPGT